jgi:hypothetical protein
MSMYGLSSWMKSHMRFKTYKICEGGWGGGVGVRPRQKPPCARGKAVGVGAGAVCVGRMAAGGPCEPHDVMMLLNNERMLLK